MAINKFMTVGELGSSSHTFIQGEQNDSGIFVPDAWTEHPSMGHMQGQVTDVEQMAHSLRGALSDLKLQTGRDINRIDVLGITLDQPFTICSRGMTEIRQGVVHPYDVESVMLSAQTVNLPDDYKLIHVVPLYYEVDHHCRVQDPVGLSGKRLEGCFHLLAVPKSLIENHKKVFADLSITVGQMVLTPVCAKPSQISQDEYVVVIDFGWRSTRASVYHQGSCVMVSTVPWGGAHVDQDLSICCEIKKPYAERLKIEFMQRDLPKRLSQKDQLVFQIIEARYEEILSMLYDKIKDEVDSASELKVLGVGGGYQPHFIDPIIRRCIGQNMSLLHADELISGTAYNHWAACQLFDYAQRIQAAPHHLDHSSVKQVLRRCKQWFEYHF